MGMWITNNDFADLPLIDVFDKEHGKKESQKSIAEPFAFHPFWDVFPPGQTKPTAQQREALASAAVAVAVAFCPFHNRDDQRNEKTKQSQPREQDIKKAQDQVGQGYDPEIIIPTLSHAPTSRISMTLAGHSFAHFPQPTHLSIFTCAIMPFMI